MTGKERIEGLTRTWYGFTVLAAAAGVAQVALWPFSAGLLFSPLKLLLGLVGSAFVLVFAVGAGLVGAAAGLCLVYLVGRALLGRSGLVRMALAVLTPLLAVLSGLSALRSLWAGVSHLALAPVLSACVAGMAAALYVRSFRVLVDPAVRGYVRG